MINVYAFISQRFNASTFQRFNVSTVSDYKTDLVTSRDGFADALCQGEEGLEGVLEAAGDDTGTENDAAVFTEVHSVTGFEHGAYLRHTRVECYCFFW